MLELREISVGYGRDVVLPGCSLQVRPGEVVALIGANGAGKSTLVKALSGLLPCRGGSILLDGESIEALSPRDRVRRGIAHVPEGRQVFGGLSVEDNLILGAYAQADLRDAASIKERIAESCLFFPALLERLREPAGNLSGGQQQMLAIARGLMGRPRYLLLDEPSLGLAPLLVSEIFRLVSRLREAGLSILLSEQNARQSLAVSDRAYVLEAGHVTMQGVSRDILETDEIAEKYLGGGTAIGAAPGRQMALDIRLKDILASG
ncbi:ABC transporter ATP-binding protein (plasmid) [Roseomonas sp. OT10]|uniref:ABC transporter ATP-binding protein n=1 Tax=Roseomonas cutis TaxID=2897332 RepID=UPI001E4CCC92|nr:ABC transporter ATP-binding protein [Roseomonas sp. OT10]UFN51532.1 ABC transporter ATP-binding protein [Roseomonas sp. OT10]